MSDAQQKLQQLSQLQHTLVTYQNQEQQVRSQILEIETAISEINSTEECYRIIGNIMIKKDASSLQKELEEKIETLQLRLSSFEKQIKQLDDKIKKLQEEVVAQMHAQGEKMSEEMLESIIEALEELEAESSVPKNVRERIVEIREELKSNIELHMKVNRALSYLDEISDSIHLPSYIRTQIWNISSALEKIDS